MRDPDRQRATKGHAVISCLDQLMSAAAAAQRVLLHQGRQEAASVEEREGDREGRVVVVGDGSRDEASEPRASDGEGASVRSCVLVTGHDISFPFRRSSVCVCGNRLPQPA